MFDVLRPRVAGAAIRVRELFDLHMHAMRWGIQRIRISSEECECEYVYAGRGRRLQANGGGNENAKRKYFAKYDELKFPKPESNETSKIKGFVKAALLDKIWMEDEGGGHAADAFMGTRDDAIPNAHREKSPDLFGGLFEDETNNNAEQQQQQDQEKDNATVNWSRSRRRHFRPH